MNVSGYRSRSPCFHSRLWARAHAALSSPLAADCGITELSWEDEPGVTAEEAAGSQGWRPTAGGDGGSAACVARVRAAPAGGQLLLSRIKYTPWSQVLIQVKDATPHVHTVPICTASMARSKQPTPTGQGILGSIGRAGRSWCKRDAIPYWRTVTDLWTLLRSETGNSRDLLSIRFVNHVRCRCLVGAGAARPHRGVA